MPDILTTPIRSGVHSAQMVTIASRYAGHIRQQQTKKLGFVHRNVLVTHFQDALRALQHAFERGEISLRLLEAAPTEHLVHDVEALRNVRICRRDFPAWPTPTLHCPMPCQS